MKPYWNPDRRAAPASTVFETRAILRNAGMWRPISGGDATELQWFNRQALHNMMTGHASGEALGIVITALNKAMVLAEMGYGPEWIPLITEALEGAFRATVRGERTGQWGFDGRAMAPIKEAMSVLESQLEHAPRVDLLKAMATINQRFNEGNVYTLEDLQK